MKNPIHTLLLAIGLLAINGCDTIDYSDSTYKKLNIAELVDMENFGGYRLASSGTVNFKPTYVYLYFCKNNRYKYGDKTAKFYEGNYSIDIDKSEIIFKGDDLDSTGKHLYGTMKVKKGYFRQKEDYRSERLGLKFENLVDIDPSDCIVEDW
jgi:hypothetical protein